MAEALFISKLFAPVFLDVLFVNLVLKNPFMIMVEFEHRRLHNRLNV